MFEYRRSIGSDAIQAVKDFTINSAYAAVAVKGDIVKLNASGEVVAAATNDVLVLGEYLGLNPKMEKETVLKGKVRTAAESVYEVTPTGGTPVVGQNYPITAAAGDYKLNAAVTTTPLLRVIGLLANGNVEAMIIGRQFV